MYIILKARRCWPHHATHNQDISLRKDKWNERYKKERIVQWDNTNITIDKPGDASMQRSTWNSYYNANCAKGGVYLQLCGWMGVDNLWVESVSDTDYMLKSNIFKRQDSYASDDIENNQQKIPL